MTEVNRNEFAEILGYSPKWIGDLMKDGLPHQGGGGRGKPIVIDTKAAIQWIIDREVQKQVGLFESENASPKEGTKNGEDLLLTRAKRRKADVEAKKAEESVIDIEDLAQFLYSVANLFGSELDGAGSRTAQEIAAENDPVKCKFIIDNENKRIRASTADRISAFVADYLRE